MARCGAPRRLGFGGISLAATMRRAGDDDLSAVGSTTMTSPGVVPRAHRPSRSWTHPGVGPRVAARAASGRRHGSRSGRRRTRQARPAYYGGMTYVIAQPCVDLKDKACIEECPVDCIYEGERSLYIHPDECVDCGACEPVCPVEAIYYEDDTPEQWADYYKANVEFFDDLGSPGGAAKMGLIPKDHPFIADLPPQDHERLTRRLVAPPAGLPLGLARSDQGAGEFCCRLPTALGLVDLSVGTPVDPTPQVVQEALRSAADAPGYPQTWGTPALREAVATWFATRRGVPTSTPTGFCRRSAARSWWPGCRPSLVWGRATSSASLLPPTRPTTSGRDSRVPPRWPSTDSPPLVRSCRQPRQNCCGSTLPATPRARSSASSTSPRSWPGHVSTGSSSPVTSATPSWTGAPTVAGRPRRRHRRSSTRG